MTQYTLDNTDDIFLTYIETWEQKATEVMIARGQMYDILDSIRSGINDTFGGDPDMKTDLIKRLDIAHDRLNNGDLNKAKLSIEGIHDEVFAELDYLESEE